ncbi:hypothetical protein CWI75_02400 [Kineobactrum sediminis]|uniref:Sensor domain-containing diguanylate cyclase n=1 Tax=Kineobactrum sediminis TaxID=1905677 RepID=A0A2N5Y756_9GAMM|nr:EAL domain-containing protein [Kineobactrum sediminis]PLW84216.1 hypothetical protein CWI75_02400 [Kineobactrum sediminis]
MSLRRLSRISIIACLLGLALLLIVGTNSLKQMQTKQEEILELIAIQGRIDALSVGSDAILVNQPHPALWTAFLGQARSMQQALSEMTERFPSARRASRNIDYLINALETATASAAEVTADTAQPTIPLRSRVIMNQVAGYGIALTGALEEVIIQHQAQVARDANWIAAVFAGAATVFSVFCLVGFGLLFKRINGPLQALSKAARRVEGGEYDVRVPVSGSDEFADVSRTFNHMLDQQGDMVEALSSALANSRALINSLPAHIALLDGEGKVVDVNDQWRHFGTSNENQDPDFGVGSNYLSVCRDVIGDCAEEAFEAADGLQSVLAGDRDSFALEYPCHSPDQPRWFRMMATRLTPDKETEGMLGAVVMHVDITERKLAEQELKLHAYQDPLTGLANRLGFIEAFARHTGQHGWNPEDTIVLLDIREMRNVNEAHGYHIGDRLLIELARRLEDRLWNRTLIGRLSGDQFIVLLPGGHASSPHDRLEKVTDIFHQPVQLSETVIEIAVDGGFTLLGEKERSAEVLLHEVEIALHENRGHDKGVFRLYDSEMYRRAQQRINLARELRQALEDDQFELHYQPKVDLATGTMIGCEALIRWMHPDRGLQMPGQFIPVAEQSQLIGPIGDWVLFQACRDLREWQAANLDLVRVSVNVSVDQFRPGDFPEKVREALEIHGIDPAALTLEITESVFSEESETLNRQLNDLHQLGVKLSLDDFGTGYSSLLYLQRYPFDEIKIDMGFVRGILDNAFNRNIVSMILGISQVLGADIVAEGVENAAVRDVLLELGCRIGQGYHYSMPLEVEDFRWLLEKHSRLPLTLHPDATSNSMTSGRSAQ